MEKQAASSFSCGDRSLTPQAISSVPGVVDEAAMLDVEGNDVSYLIGTTAVIDMQQDPQRAAFAAYRIAFRANAWDPNLPNAAARVDAWNRLREVMGIGP